MRGGGWDGRGNLRENREDPAPTVGHLRGFQCASHCDPNVAHWCRHARTIPTPHATHLWGPYGFYHDAAPNRDAARHVATNALPPYAHARPSATVCAYHATHGDPGFYNDAARRVATVFE